MGRGIAKLQWFEQLRADPAITATAFVVAYEIARHVNHQSGTCWPSHATLAAGARVSDRQARTLIDTLIRQGHLARKSGGGRRVSNTYSLIVKTRKPNSGFSAENPEAQFRDSKTKPGNPAHETRKSSARNPEAHFRGTPFMNPVHNPEGETRTFERAAFAALDVAFEELCKAYPSNHGGDIDVARSNFTNAIANGDTLDAIVDGARRYAASGNSPLYLAVWLKQQGWRKDWQPAAARPRRNFRNDRDPLAAARRMMGGEE